jgi:AcrR family transcriptional regulator
MEEPRNVRSRRTRARLLEAAWDLLVAEGPEATTMSAVGRTADVSRRGVYLHFSSRSDLLVALAGHVDGKLGLEASLADVKAAPDAVTMLDETVRHLVDYHSAALPLLEALQRAPESDEDAALLWTMTLQNWRRGWGELAVALQAEGVLADRWTVSAATDALVALVVGFMSSWRQLVDESGWSRDEVHVFYRDLHRATFLQPREQAH